MFKKFFKSLKGYVNYLMSVNFKELFINVLVLICILALSSFVAFPIGAIQNIVREFIILFTTMSNTFMTVYDWIFIVISYLAVAIAFIYLFNKRFEDIEVFKKQLKEKPVREEKQVTSKEEIDLPKIKNKK